LNRPCDGREHHSGAGEFLWKEKAIIYRFYDEMNRGNLSIIEMLCTRDRLILRWAASDIALPTG
jgi:hypothetical protein